MSEQTIRIGMIGAGANTRKHHIPGLANQSGVAVVAVADRSKESGERVAQEFGIEYVATDWTEIVDDDHIDAVCIGTWPYMHAPMTIAALETGKHVLCEARMAMNALEAHAMLEASRKRPGLTAQIVPAPHTLAFDQTIVDMISKGYIGDLISLDAHVAAGSQFPQWDSAVHWRHDRDFCGNNVMSMGIWYEAIMRWIGPASTVHAVGQTVVTHRRGEDGHRVAMAIPDHIEVSCRMAQGGQIRLMVSTVIGHAPALSISIYGTEGTIRLAQGEAAGGGLQLAAGRRGDAGLRPVDIDPKKRGGWRVEEEFINAIRGKEPVTHTDLVTAVKYMEWTDAVARSARSGATVHLPLELD
jgi:predicted dehydrogenase